MRLRTLIFWTHLAAGVVAGIVILVMCLTGVLLTYERQVYAWFDRGFQSQAVPAGATRMPIATVLTRVQAQVPDVVPASVTVAADDRAPVTVVAGPQTLYVDAYSGQILGESRAGGARRVMSSVKAWHRWLAIEGDARPTGRAITGWSNLLFLFIVGSGIYLWVPRIWSWRHLKAVTLFNGRLRGKARDFNWHNVIGSWTAIPLFIVVFSAVPISFPWANAAVYRAMGEPAPTPGVREAGGGREGRGGGVGREGRAGSSPNGADTGRNAAAAIDGLDRLLARAQQQEPAWRTISLRLPGSSRAPLAFAIDRGNGGQPQLRSTLTLTPNGDVVSYEDFGSQTPARRARSLMRFAHTGEVLGLPGQTVAGLVTAGGAVLVYTGIALALRRLSAFMVRRSKGTVPAVQSAT